MVKGVTPWLVQARSTPWSKACLDKLTALHNHVFYHSYCITTIICLASIWGFVIQAFGQEDLKKMAPDNMNYLYSESRALYFTSSSTCYVHPCQNYG